MKNYAKLFLVTAMAVMLVALTACSSNNGGGGGNNAPNATNTANAGGEANAGDAANSPADEPKPELKRLGIWQNEDYNTYPVAKMLEEKTGYKVKYDMLPQDKYAEKQNLIMPPANRTIS